jgi:hypothetical protein
MRRGRLADHLQIRKLRRNNNMINKKQVEKRQVTGQNKDEQEIRIDEESTQRENGTGVI